MGVGVLRRDGERGGVFTELQPPPAPPPPHTHTDVRGSVSNRQTGTYLYIGLTFHRMCCPFLAGQQVWVGAPAGVLAMLRKGSWITLC